MSSGGSVKMPTPTSKIPLPKTSLSSSKLDQDMTISSTPTVSKIPVIKNLKSPAHEISYSGSTPNKENIFGSDIGQGGKKSRIPDIRSKISPGRDVLDIDGGYKSDHSTKSGGSSSTPSRIPGASSTFTKIPSASKLPVSPPTRLPTSSSGSRIPTLLTSSSPTKNLIKSSTESLDELDWDTTESPRHRRSMTPGEEIRGRASSVSDLTPSSSSSSSYSPHKRSRDENVRTSPDGESTSPTKSRRGGSPSKIPIAGAYLGSRGSSEDLLSVAPLPLAARHQSQPSDDDDEDMLVGGGEGMAESVLGADFLGLHDAGVRRLPAAAPAAKSRIPAPSSGGGGTPTRAIPELNWSISREDTPPKNSPRDEESPARGVPAPASKQPRGSQSTSRLPDPGTADRERDGSRHGSRHSTSQLASHRSSSTDSDASSTSDGNTRRRKNFEAFVMTGDRMINLAKTPANIDFQSKYYKPHTGAAVKSLDAKFSGAEDPEAGGSAPNSPSESSSHLEKNASSQRQNRLSLVRGSKSEDQLAAAELDNNSSEEERILINSSCHTLLDPDTEAADTRLARLRTVASAAPQVSSESSSSRSLGSTDTAQLPPRQASDEATSPDFSTSSLISMSEHYNGDSLVDPGQMSPQSPSSPDTPEWSLIANGDSFHKDLPSSHSKNKSNKKNAGTSDGSPSSGSGKQNGSLITSKDNRVIITINTKERRTEDARLLNGETSPGSSCGTLTPGLEAAMSPPPQPATSPPPSLSSEEESDLDSLHSYHPPVKIVDIPSATRLAKRLYNLEGFRKSDISRHLSKNNDFSRAVAEEYCKSLDEALRKFLQQFCLTGETQDRERVLLHFSKRFLECNSSLRGPTFQSHDAVHTLTCAIMLLNTDLHNEALQQRRMTVDEFVENLAELNDGCNFPDELLREVYAAIKAEPIEWVQDSDSGPDSELSSEAGAVAGGGAAGRGARPLSPPQPGLGNEVTFGQQSGGINPFLSMPDPETSVDYKRGYVMRKSCFDSNKKKTKIGKRSWKMFYLSLRDLVLYCFKDEKSAQLSSSYESPMSAVRIHHALAAAAGDYTKKQFVFRLRTCDRAEYLFQTSDQKELETWVDTINTVVSRYSSPPLPAPCSNSIKFQRPLYPSSRSSQPLVEQLASHRGQVRDLSRDLATHTAQPPDRGDKAVIWASYREKSEFLEQELERFSVYISVLENLISKHENNQILSSPLKIIMN